ncbi:glycosyltransferase family 2 protein [Flavobacterium algicola]|uniref:glycosyltransferase family 2 protein n=1 Tax=Flavobacterium algicola TaxID=556529 RepID=UPI001EFEA793|nr:glycosyltransferase family 2 protein [Flavobacterium algicola]MCG9793904.1 glycosyltransferase [Flavobacterium algicola]
MKNSVSVIIPVYNCERFVAKAIESALVQPEVTEVVVVDDGSQDASLAICKALQLQDSRIKIFQHPNGVNKGRSASRNLALQNATGNYIAFLDADDYYLENRFINDFLIFQSNENCEGVYNAIGTHFYRIATKLERETHNLFTINQHIVPELLFDALLTGKYGHFSIDGLTVKREVFKAVGYLNENLVVAEDTELIWKMAIKCNLFAGIISNAVAIRGVHEENVFDDTALYKRNTLKMLVSLLVWCANNNVEFSVYDKILNVIWINKEKQKKTLLQNTYFWGELFLPNKALLFSIFAIKYFPVIRFRQSLFPFLYKNNH